MVLPTVTDSLIFTFMRFYYVSILLFIGYMAIQDIKTRNVSNPVILVFYALLVPAVVMNYPNRTIYHGVLVFIVVTLYLANGMGGADMKVLVPLILTMNEGMMYLFIVSMLSFSAGIIGSNIIQNKKNTVPGMFAIFAGYAIVVMVGMI